MQTFCESVFNCSDLFAILNDVEIQFSIAALIIMLLTGIAIGRLSYRQAHRKNSGTLPYNRSGLRLRLRRSATVPSTQTTNNWWSEFWQGISTELFGAIVTTLLLSLGVLVFEQYDDIQSWKNALTSQLSSPDNAFALESLRLLQAEGWIDDGTLANKNFSNADLSNAGLQFADFSNAILFNVNFNNADLQSAILVGADLRNADLSGTNLYDANLSRADLTGNTIFSSRTFIGADLSHADLRGLNLYSVMLNDTILCGTDLRGAILQNVTISREELALAILDETTIMPDGNEWSEESLPLVSCESQLEHI